VAAGENRVPTPVGADDGGVLYAAPLLRASSMQSSPIHSCCSGENPRSGSSGSYDGVAVGVALPLGHHFQLLDGSGKRWCGVHLPRRRCLVLVASGAVLASMASERLRFVLTPWRWIRGKTGPLKLA
jgi:hypothetical protein